MRSMRETMRADTRLSGLVSRYHSWPTLTHQSVGEHSWQVLRIYIEIFGPPTPEVTVYIVYHDSAEVATGDPPFPLKANNPDLKAIYDRLEHTAMVEMRGVGLPELNEQQRNRVKICDLLEMWEHGMHEITLGNTYAHPIVEDTMAAARIIASTSAVPDEDREAVDAYIMRRTGL